MNEWNKIKIGEHIETTLGFPFDSSKFNIDGIGVPLIRIRDLLYSKIETYYAGNYKDEYLIVINDILIGMDGDFNIAKWKNTINGLLNQRIMKITQRENALIDIDYLFYFLIPFLKRVHNITASTTVKHLSHYDIADAIELFPSLPEQHKIAKILSTIDAMIEKTEQAIAKYKSIKQGMMQALFTRGVDENGKLRPRYEDASHLYENKPPFGWVPKEWVSGRVENFCEVHNYLRKPISSETRESMHGAYPYYGCTGILGYINEYRVDGKYVLIGEDGDHFLKFDQQPMTLLVAGKYNVNNHAHILKGTTECLTDWIHAFFVHRDITLYLTRQGAGRFKLNKNALLNMPMFKPALDEQKRIIDRFFSIEGKIKAEGQLLNKLVNVKQGLMQDLLTGRKRVKITPPNLPLPQRGGINSPS